MAKTTLYGIKNCDTIKKARKWLEANEISFDFHDYRKDGIDIDMLSKFEAELGWENLLNKRGTTFRKLDDNQKADLDCEKALALLLEYPAMVKRPVVICDEQYQLGFKADQYQAFFKR